MSLQDDRSWMYSGWNVDGHHSQEWVRNTNAFIDLAFQIMPHADQLGVRCPCSKCHNGIRRKKHLISNHFCQHGFMPGYTRWVAHGERPVVISDGVEEEPYVSSNPLNDMLGDIEGAAHVDHMEEEPTSDAKAFYKMVSAAEELLHCSTQVSRLTAVTRLMGIKSHHNLSAECVNSILSLIGDILPENHKMPASMYDCKSLLAGLKMPYVKIDACINNCMIYYKEDGHKQKCDICGESHYEVIEGEILERRRSPVPRKVLRYLPITPRLQRMYMAEESAKHLQWHKFGQRKYAKGLMGHPSNGEAWEHFDKEFPSFAKDARNIRVAIATDGFNPFGFGASQYSCWPVFVLPLNLPPALCLKEENIILSLVIPGPKHPGKNMNVFMRPLVDELKDLWRGVPTYDSASKQNFNMRVSSFFSIHDYPAFGSFSGWCTHGMLACAVCMGNVHATWLPNGHKYSWFDCHRQFLPTNHRFRRQHNAFRRQTRVFDMPPCRLTGDEVLANINRVKYESFEGYGRTHNWTHMPILWELPYFSKLLLRHNIDVMHNEKNVAEAILNTCLDMSDKTKDNARARLDQALICNRINLNLIPRPNNKWQKPRAPYCLTRANKKEIMQWLQQLKFPDGYATNLRRGVNMEQLKINGLKSHDYHILMERLFPVMLHGFVDEDVWEVFAELSHFYRLLYGKEVDPSQMLQLEQNIAVIICKLEKLFPPGFFNSMEHLMVHLPYEARVGGPVQYRWMYLYERFIKKLRKMVTNKARVEGSIVEAYLLEEISHFTSLYLPNLIPNSQNRTARYAQGGLPSTSALSLFQVQGWKSGRGVPRVLTIDEYKTTMIYVLTNLAEMDELV